MFDKFKIYVDTKLIKSPEALVGLKLKSNKGKTLFIQEVNYCGDDFISVNCSQSLKPLQIKFDTQKHFTNLFIEYKVNEIDQYVETSKSYQVNKLHDDFVNEDVIASIRLKCYNYLKVRGVNNLYHFTSILNLKNIIGQGLLTRDKLRKSAWKNDFERLDKTNGICLSISFPNYSMFYKYRQKRNNMRWVVLELDPLVVLDKNCIFCYTNASSIEFQGNIYKDRLNNISGLKKLYEDPLTYTFKSVPLSRNSNIPTDYPTDAQAEIIVLDDIQKKYIKNFIVETTQDRDSLLNLLRISSSVNAHLFGARGDHNSNQTMENDIYGD